MKNMKNHNNPKVKIREFGTGSVSDTELLSLFFRNENGLPTGKAKSLQESVGHNLNALAKLSIPDMILLGVNESAAVYLTAAVELGRRRNQSEAIDNGQIKGSKDFLRLHNIHAKGSFFVTRAKDSMRFKRMYSKEVDKTSGVLSDQIGKLETYKSKKEYPDKLRRIKFYGQEINQVFVFINNNTVLEASEIALLYKKRWEVELFFYEKLFIMQSRRINCSVNQYITSQIYTTTLQKNIISEELSASQPDHDSSPIHVPWPSQEQGLYKLFQALHVSA